MLGPWNAVKDAARKVAKVEADAKMPDVSLGAHAATAATLSLHVAENTPPCTSRWPARVLSAWSPCACANPQALDPNDYVERFRPDLMEPVAAWVKGAAFKSMKDYTSIFEVRRWVALCPHP